MTILTDWLFDYMRRAECHAHLRVVALVISQEKELGEPYTQDETMMAELRASYRDHEKRLKDNSDD